MVRPISLHTSSWFADFNGDGNTDLLFDNTTGPGIAVWYMDGTQVVTGAQVGTLPPTVSSMGSAISTAMASPICWFSAPPLLTLPRIRFRSGK
jgi:hypothetical protein